MIVISKLFKISNSLYKPVVVQEVDEHEKGSQEGEEDTLVKKPRK